MGTSAKTATPAPLLFGRHIVGMMILALASPYIWYDSQPVMTWTMTWIVPAGMALAAFGLFALFFTNRAKAAWPGRFFMLAWVLLGLVVAAPYLETFNKKQAQQEVGRPAALQPVAPPSQSSPAVSPNNPFSDPNYGKELLQKQ
ncbi:hypothetical protein [Diaphorobacter nitroreducens]|uniref:hypothetical protein n=1 Tax=Diaphorobacter nitroreducens TaxID=164759 RepID=UPI0028B17948|nr:hypothetical protein [Diaphorobacter nitroreducens]